LFYIGRSSKYFPNKLPPPSFNLVLVVCARDTFHRHPCSCTTMTAIDAFEILHLGRRVKRLFGECYVSSLRVSILVRAIHLDVMS
jgi:hypothetical protein